MTDCDWAKNSRSVMGLEIVGVTALELPPTGHTVPPDEIAGSSLVGAISS